MRAAGLAFLVRHAKAEGSAPGGDAARRLTPEGRAAFAALAASLAREVRVTRILSSPFSRARQTAELLADATGAPVELEAALASGASGGRDLLALLRRLGPGTALVGHNPEVAEAVALAGRREVEVRPGTVAAVEPGGALAWLRSP